MGRPRAPDGRSACRYPRAVSRWVLFLSRRDLRPAAGQDRSGADRADPDPDRRALRRRAPAGRAAGRRLDARRRGSCAAAWPSDRAKIAPVPPEPIPILIGGHSGAALRRAARLGDGWMHGGGDPAQLPGLLARLAELRRAEGAADRPFEVHVISADAFSVDGVRRLEEQGVTDLIVGFRWPYETGQDTEPLAAKIGKLSAFADQVIARVRR